MWSLAYDFKLLTSSSDGKKEYNILKTYQLKYHVRPWHDFKLHTGGISVKISCGPWHMTLNCILEAYQLKYHVVLGI